jgi:hypothetical protein
MLCFLASNQINMTMPAQQLEPDDGKTELYSLQQSRTHYSNLRVLVF